MASPKSALSGSSKAPQIVSEDQNAAFQDKVRQRVAERAFDIYQNSGGQPGNDYEHWIQAENEVLQRGIEVRESGSWLAFNASIPNSSADNVEICLTPTSVTVRAEKSEQINDANTDEQGLNQREIFLTHDLNTEIEPSTASATLKDQKLTIMVKKRYPVSSSASVATSTTSPSTSSVAQSLSKKESAKA
jgi:HSP20 family molecular chaperone IbpA